VYNENCYHIPVLQKEVLDGLGFKNGRGSNRPKIFVDATAGGMGHSAQIASRLTPNDKIICIDKDINAFKNKENVISTCEKVFVNDSFDNIKEILEINDIKGVDGILADLGVSSHQIDTADRGFSYMKDGPLCMRMDQTQKRDARHVVNNYTPARLEEIIREYGEERYAKMITSAIVKARPIETTLALVKVITGAVPGNYYKTGGHPAKRTFQAIRIEVNRELEVLEKFIYDAVEMLNPGGRLAVITFHSLEDRIVKHALRYLEKSCVCPPKTPKCICEKKSTVINLTKRPILPTIEEQNTNPRSQSAKLRVAEKGGKS